MSRSDLDAILQELINDTSDTKTSASSKNKKVNYDLDDDDDDWDRTPRDSKKPISNTATAQANDFDDLGLDGDDRWNQTAGSNFSYMPPLGGTGTLANTFSGQDTIQRIVSQPRPATSSGSRKFDDLFGSSPPKSTLTGDTDKSKKIVRFEEFELGRPSTAPAPTNTLQNPSSSGVISAMRTGLEPNKSFSTMSSNKTAATTTPAESNDPNAWLGLKDESTEDEHDDFLSRPKQKVESVVTTLAKKTLTTPIQAKPQAIPEQPKKWNIEDFLDNDKEQLKQPIIVPPVTSTKTSPSSWLQDLTTTDKRSTSLNTPKTTSLTEVQPAKSTAQKLFDSDNDLKNVTFRDTEKESLFTNDPSVSAATRSNQSTVNLDVKKLQYENNELRMTLDHIKRQNEVERAMLEEGYKHRIEYIEKSCERRESRLKEENEHLLRQLNDRTQQFENEKSTLILDHQRRLDDLQRDRTTELENLRALQRQTVDHLRREHEQTIQRLKQLKQEELATALDVTTHTRAFESVVDHMEQNAKNIDELRLKLEAKHSSVLSEKEVEARAKEQQLKAYEERLRMQSVDFERERKNLQDLIARLEVHLSEQTKLVEEERWKALQAQKRMEAEKDALSSEQRIFMEKIARERTEIQRGKDQLLEDQKVTLASVYESRSQLAGERAKVEALQKTFQEQKHRDMLQAASIEAEARAQQKVVSEQMARLEKREQEIIKREEALSIERRSLVELKQRVEIEQSTIKNEHEDIKQKLLDIEHANNAIQKEKERLSQLYFELHALDGKNTGRLQQLQQSIQTLRQQEEHMSEQYSRMADDRQNRTHLRSSVTLGSQSPMKDTGFSTMQLVSATPLLTTTTSAQQSIEESAVLRSLRMNALQDQLYIQDEMSFLSSLRAANPLLPRTGTSNSNLHRHTDYNLLRTNH
ncbi:unnamed protein product [Adineta ricciae]|uniref:Fas-binding factor 1 C-terminal domain-containing protein n=1 Tax=Adineta ricciae TaxID=249248 RepID=A0A815G083_ADIRI|nr:unnamed protein product [Adineta ricciae]CAF1332238.1 unnamed protein product [Adineta ricciae]